ncbi:MAG: kynureninase [Vulcanimicrobiota bacterium]
MKVQDGLKYAQQLDREDPLAGLRSGFHIPKTEKGEDCIYLCGNSLGLQPLATQEAVLQELDDWRKLGVEGHFQARNPWMPYHEFLTESYARLVGALPSEVVAMNSLTVNLHLLMVSFFRPTPERYKIIIEGGAFPSDQYAVKSQLEFHGYSPEGLVELLPRPGERTLRTEDILEAIEREGPRTALVLLGGVNYYTGQFYPLEAVARAAHAQGCVVGYDLAHAVGNVPLKLHDWGVDFACWCSYKYLNSGPGSLAGAFVHQRHESTERPRFAGWWGHDKKSRFKMGPDFHPIPGAEGWQLSNPPILSLAAVKASLEIFEQVGMEALRAKSLKLTGYLLELLQGPGFEILTPLDPEERGCQVSLLVERGGRELFDTLTQEGVICDWREPDCIRIAPVPLYNSFQDVYRFCEIVRYS